MLVSRIALGAIALSTLFLTTQACSSDDAEGTNRPGGSNKPNGETNGTDKPGGENNPGGENPGNTTPGNTTPGGGGAGEGHLIPSTSVWHRTTEWYRAIDTAPVADSSAEMIGALKQWGTTGIFQIDFSISVLDGAGAPKVRIQEQDEADDDPVPIPAKG